jgi:prolyl-tRNA editing enzyme YbaK/EbsC (Cys-tRNA(Pro) deacylase)
MRRAEALVRSTLILKESFDGGAAVVVVAVDRLNLVDSSASFSSRRSLATRQLARETSGSIIIE